MGYVYLIKEHSESDRYKIGATRKKNVTERVKELQTGNSHTLSLIASYESNKPFKLEKMLHNHYYNEHELNEWFILDKEKVENFLNTCDKYQKIIDCLKDNPFFY